MSAVVEAREPSAKYLSTLQLPLVQHFELMATAPGGVARLRELILALAVQGKLVSRDPNDKPASELLKQIRAERALQIAEGKAKRGKPLAELTEEDRPFAIPRTWCWVRLGDITNYGSPVKAGALVPDTWVLDMEDIEKSSGRLLQKLRFIDRPALSDKNSFTKGDVLYGKLRPYLNKVLVADEDGVCTTEIIPFRCYGDYEPGYFRLALSSPYFLEYVNARSYGMKMPRLGTDDARNAPLPLPPLAEQSRIVTRVEELMRLCDALEAKGQLEAVQHAQLVQTLLGALTASTSPEELADNWQRVATHFDLLLDRPEAIDALEQTILQLAVRGLLVPQDPKEEPASELLKKIRAERERLIGEGKVKREKLVSSTTENEQLFPVPASWKWVRLGDVSKVISGFAFSSQDLSSETGVRVIKITNAGVGEFCETDDFLPARFAVGFDGFRATLGDLIIALTRPYVSNGLKISKLPQTYDGALINQRVAAIRLHAGLAMEFAFTYLRSEDVLRIYKGRFNGSGLQPNLKVSDVTDLVMPLPPLEEQLRIVARVESLCRLCADLRQRLAARQTTQAHLAEALIDEVA